MDECERRREKRLKYNWPIWFAEDYDKTLSCGQMVDVSSGGTAFICKADRNCPLPGQKVTSRFNVPRLESDGSSHMASLRLHGQICRVDEVDEFYRRVAMQFAKPLNFNPGEQAGNETETQQRIKLLTI